MNEKLAVLFAALATASCVAAFELGAAEARPSQASKSLVGKYTGTTEEGGKVSFRVTSDARVVGFTLTNATLYCLTESSGKIPIREPEYKKPLPKITRGPMSMRGVSKKFPQGREFEVFAPGREDVARETGNFSGKVVELTSGPHGGTVLPGKGFKGEVEYETANGPTPFPSSQNPTPTWPPGAEWCVTKAIDWTAKQVGSPGFVPEAPVATFHR